MDNSNSEDYEEIALMLNRIAKNVIEGIEVEMDLPSVMLRKRVGQNRNEFMHYPFFPARF